ncbi:hypothetical protein SDC9_201070 [bioreactor metagenome]|uniref:Uncharacterized protein n=1 Tax=bioreactor metagenome TaxID=1076179 RepID=A0A645IQN3_9ZZZZ
MFESVRNGTERLSVQGNRFFIRGYANIKRPVEGNNQPFVDRRIQRHADKILCIECDVVVFECETDGLQPNECRCFAFVRQLDFASPVYRQYGGFTGDKRR